MEEDRIDQVVLAYLKRKGYRAAELAFQSEKGRAGAAVSSDSAAEEPAMDPVIANQIYFYSRADGSGPERYRDGYGRLRSWVHTSLDQYKNELLRILYPVFMHSFMELVAKGFAREAHAFFQAFREDHEALHQKDLQVVEGLATPQHLEESEVARSLRETKLGIRMCQYSFELLLQYLHNTDSMLMLGIVNEHINLQVFPGQPSPLFQDEEAVTLTGKPQAAVDLINQKDIRWGALEDSLDDKLAKEIAANGEMGEMGGKDGQGEDAKKRGSEGGKPGSSTFKKLKKERTAAGAAAVAAAAKGVKSEAVGSAAVPRVKAELPLPTVTEEWEAQALADLRNRVRLGSNALPSVSFYSFINTHNGLNCASISADGGLVAGGFSDSSVKLWDMAKAGDGGAAAPSSEHGLSNGSTKSPLRGIKGGPTMDNNSQASYRLFQGHSGPVYAANFSPDGNYLLSASADSTVRLWSLNMNANLVCYKGHNYPVWDIQYCPVGHYFASASHDRTARIWSMERTQPLRIMAGHLSDVDCVQWHVNCNYIATGSSDKTVRLWDVQTGECMRMFTGHLGMVVSLAMSPDGRYMASGDEDGAIMMWDLGSSRCVTPLMGHTGAVWTLAFSGEGSLVASGSADCTVRLWDVNSSAKLSRAEDKTGSGRRLRLLKVLPTKSTPVYSLRFSRRNLLLAAGAFNVPKPTKSTDKSS